MHYSKLIDKFLNSYQSSSSTIFYVVPHFDHFAWHPRGLFNCN